MGIEAKLTRIRKRWRKLNPPNHQGYYTCALCFRWVHESEMSLDHILPRSRRPDLVLEITNLQPTHYLCNSKKGSRIYESHPWTKTSFNTEEA